MRADLQLQIASFVRVPVPAREPEEPRQNRARARARVRLGKSRGWASGLLMLLSGCAGTQHPDPKTAGLRTIVEPPAALVQVDESFVGAARVLDKRPERLLPGKHRVTVEAPGYFPHDLELDLAPGVTTIELKLRKMPP